MTNPKGLAVDGGGNVYIGNPTAFNNGGNVLKVPPGDLNCTSSCTTLGTGLNGPYDVALDGSGNVYIADAANRRIVKIDRVTPLRLSFANTVVGVTSSPQTARGGISAPLR